MGRIALGLVGFMLTMGLSINASAASKKTGECISQTEMEEIARDFRQFSSIAKGEYCLDGSQTANLISALMYLRKTRFMDPMTPSDDELFSGRFGANWYEYFVGRIDSLSVVSSCPKGVGAYVYMFGDKTMYVCPMMLTDSFSALDRASIMMHEARHIDGFPHVTCRRGARAGLQGACDSRISDGGSYAVSVETYAQVAKYGQELHPATRAYARASAVIYADEAFDTPAQIHRSSQFLVLDKQSRFHRFSIDGQKTVETLGDSPQLGRIVMRSQHMILFPDDKSERAEFVFASDEGTLAQEAGDIPKEYNSQSPEQRAQLVDVHIAAQWSARVYSQKVRLQCNPRSEATQDVSLSSPAAALVYPNGYSRSDRSALLLTTSGTVMEIGCNNGQAFARNSSQTFDRPFKRVYKSGEKVLGLTAAGQLYEIRGANSVQLATPFDGEVHEIAPNQTFDFFN